MKNMKYISALAAAVLASTVAVQQAQANSILPGSSIQFSGGGTLYQNNLGTLTTATTLNSAGSIVIPGSDLGTDEETIGGSGTGSYLGVVGNTPVTWHTPLSFAVGNQALANLWSFTIGTTTYDFDLSSIASYVVNGADSSATLTGYGTLDITGDVSANGNFVLDLTDSNSGGGTTANFGFTASSSVVPDGGLTVALLGGALVGLQMFRRKLSC